MLTVAQILPELNSGGVERGTLEVAEGLVQAGHRSIVISGGGRLVEPLREAGSEHITLPVGRKSPKTLAMIPRVRRLLADHKVDVIHARSRVPAWVTHFALKGQSASNRPAFVTTVHGLYSVNRFSKIMTAGERVVCVSNTVRDYVINNYNSIDTTRLDVIHRGVDPTLYNPGYRAGDDWESRFRNEFDLGDRPLIVLAGRLTRLKGHTDFLELMKRLSAIDSNAIGLIVGGEDPRRASYAASLRTAAVSVPTVRMVGHRNDLKEIMSISGCVLSLSSHPESFGRTVLEALSLGIPVAGYDHGGVGEILETLFPPGRVPVGNIDALTQTVSGLLSGSHNGQIVENTSFTLGEMVAQTLNLYESVGRAA